MPHSIYLRNGLVLIPTQFKTEAGFYRAGEPVRVFPVADKTGIQSALLAMIADGNPVIPTPHPHNRPPPVLPEHAGVKSWSAFARGTSTWSIYDKCDTYSINFYRAESGGSFAEDKEREIPFPAGTPVETVVERMIAILEEAAKA